jgi:hypothetical protein
VTSDLEIAEDYLIVHFEDDTQNWQPLTVALEAAIDEALCERNDSDPNVLSKPGDQPLATLIEWRSGNVRKTVGYYFVQSTLTEPIAKKIRKSRNVTFIIDVMRPRGKRGLESTIAETLVEIAPYVQSMEAQARLFTAYSEADGIVFPENVPKLIKKGLETEELLSFLLSRLGLGED